MCEQNKNGKRVPFAATFLERFGATKVFFVLALHLHNSVLLPHIKSLN